MAMTCKAILYFPVVSAWMMSPSLAAMARTPVTATSRARIKIATSALTRSMFRSRMSADKTNSLSAIGSSSLPSFVT